MSKKFKCLENETMNRVYAKKEEAKRAAELRKNYIMENIVFYNHKNKRHQRLLRQGKLYGEIHYVMNAGKETIEFLF